MLAEIGVLVPVRVEIVAVAVTVIIVGIVSEAVIYEYQSIRDEHPPKNNGKGKKKQNSRFAILKLICILSSKSRRTYLTEYDFLVLPLVS